MNPDVTPLYHCISRCVRRAFLCGQKNAHRQLWIEEGLQELVTVFALDVCGFSIVDALRRSMLRMGIGCFRLKTVGTRTAMAWLMRAISLAGYLHLVDWSSRLI